MYPRTMFDIPRNPTQLPQAHHGYANGKYQQVSASKGVSGDQFAHGVQQFRFDTAGTTWFVPFMSYFRLRCSLSQVREDGGVPLPILTHQNIAPSMGLVANLFKSVEVQLNGHTLERISDRLPQVDAFRTRTTNTGVWLSTVGKNTNFWDPKIRVRQNMVAVDGYLGAQPLTGPAYAPPVTKIQAGFDANHRVQYNAGSLVLSFQANGGPDIDVLHGSMALRRGDRIHCQHQVLQVQHVIDATRALVDVVQSNYQGRQDIDNGLNPPAGVLFWTVQRISDALDNEASGTNVFESLWRPPLGFFALEHAIPPGGQWLLELTPHSVEDFQRHAVETLFHNARVYRPGRPSLAGDVRFAVEDFQFVVYTVESDRFDNGTWLLDLDQTRCQVQSLPTDCTGLTTRGFDVHRLTDRLSFAFQDQQAGLDTQYSRSKFKIRPAHIGDHNHQASEGQDLLLERFFLTYAGQQKPTPDFDGMYTSASGDSRISQINFLAQRYVDNLMQADLFHTDGGAESFAEWKQRGPYFHFRWPKDAMDASTRASVTVKFAQPFDDGQQPSIMMFDQWRNAFKIVHKNGRININALREM